MTPYKKILIPTDGSEKTGPAILYGLNMAKTMGAEVTAMCVIDEIDHQDMMNVAVPEAETILYQNCASAVQSVAAQGLARGIKVKPVVIGGIPSSEIIEASIDHDLIIMGTAGRTGIPNLLLGSVAEKVVRSAISPVLVIHGGTNLEADRSSPRKLLIPTDGSENTKPAIAHGLGLARAFNAEVTALSVVGDEEGSGPSVIEGVGRTSSDIGSKATEFVVEEGQKLGIDVKPMIVAGKPSGGNRKGVCGSGPHSDGYCRSYRAGTPSPG